MADTARDLVYWYYPSVASAEGAIDSVLIYNYRTDRWGKQAMSVQTAVQYSSGQVTYDGLGSLYATYEDLPEIAYDSPFWLADSTIPAVLVDSGLYSLTGTPGASWLLTGDYGDLTQYTMLKRIFPRYRVDPTQASATNFYHKTLGAMAVQDSTIGLASSRFDFRRASRWHRLRIDQVGASTLNGMEVELTPAGGE